MRIGFDFDGVLCLTPFGRLAVRKPSPVPPLPDNYERFYDAPAPSSPFRLGLEYLRFAWRTNASEAVAVLNRLSGDHESYIVTGRSRAGEPLMRRWLRSHGLDDKVAGIWMAPKGLRPAQHKLAVANMLGLDCHIDDDPRTAYHLADNGLKRVFLLSHTGVPGDQPPPERLTVVRSLSEFADALD